MNKNNIKRRIDQWESFGLKCAQCGRPIDKPMVSPACLHRFCPRCLLGTNCCPVCGISTRFEIDCNFTLIVSKMKSQSKQFTKRRIVDVLNADGANLSGPDNGRYSRMSTTHEKEREQTSNSNVCHDVNPSTSSSPFTGPYGSDALLGQEAKNALQTAGIVNYIPIPATVCCSPPVPSVHQIKLTDSDGDTWNKSGNSLVYNRHSLCRNFVGYETIVLWPDGENHKLDDFPKCLLRPRYLLVPPEATVAHLVGYLFKRAEIEAVWKQQKKYRVEVMQVDEEREELRLWMDPERDIDYLIRDFKNAEAKSAYMLIVRKTQNDLNFNTNLIMAHPFKALPEQKPLHELIREHKYCSLRAENVEGEGKQNNAQRHKLSDGRQPGGRQSPCTIRPLKIVFRFVLAM